MKLIDLEPRWFVLENGGPRVGLTFNCPHCQKERLGVVFHHRGHEAIEDVYIRAHAGHPERYIWTEDGEDFINISIEPSIDASASGHWHGFIRKGTIE